MNGAELKNLTKYKELRTLKFANNLVKELIDLTPLVHYHTLYLIHCIARTREFRQSRLIGKSCC